MTTRLRKDNTWRGALVLLASLPLSGWAGDPPFPGGVYIVGGPGYEYRGYVDVPVYRDSGNNNPAASIVVHVHGGMGQPPIYYPWAIPLVDFMAPTTLPSMPSPFSYSTDKYTGTLHWAANDLGTITIRIPIEKDLLLEGTENILVQIDESQATGVLVGSPSQSVITIANSPVVALPAAPVVVNEPADGTPQAASINVTLTPQQTSSRYVTFSNLLGGSATRGSDYNLISSHPVVVPANQATGPISIWVLRNNDYEPTPKTVMVSLLACNPAGPITQGYILGTTSQGTIEIVDDMTPQDVSIRSANPTAF